MYLQLADAPAAFRPKFLDYMLQVRDQYGNLVWVREDQFDDLPDQELYDIIASQPHLNTMNGIFDGIKNTFANMKARKDLRTDAKVANKLAKADIKTAKAGAITAGTYTSPLQNITGAVKDIFNPAQPQMDTRDLTLPQFTGNAEIGVAQWWQNPLVIGGLVLGGLGLMYFATRSRTNK